MKIIETTVPLLPPSVNTYWRRGQSSTYLSKKGREFKDNVRAFLLENKLDKKLNGRLKVEILISFKGYRKRDVDNYNKAILDSFNDIVWLDDEQIFELTTKKTYGNKADSFRVVILEY